METKNYSINNRLFDDYLERMNFLNEVCIDYPDAISFAPGRPDQQFFNVQDIIACFHTYADAEGKSEKDVTAFYNYLGQYNKTKGIINETVAKLLRNDEGIEVHPEDIVMCDGAQEGMMILINTLFESQDDVLLISDPSYIGFVGYAKIYGVPICPIKRDEDSVDFDHLESTIARLHSQGKNPKVLYEVVDFHNPTGAYMPLEKRKQLIELAEKHNFYIVEDNPYGYFIYDGEKIPTLKALDKYNRVIYLGSFSKTIFPSIRLGYIAAGQEFSDGTRRIKLVEELKKTKSFTTVNTSTLLQAMAGSYIRTHDYSLVEVNRDKTAALRKKRDAVVDGLSQQFPNGGPRRAEVAWNKPQGGFFMVIDLPFAVKQEHLRRCVENYAVIFCPMSFFYLDEAAGSNRIRLAFSNLHPQAIGQGVDRLSAFIKSYLR